MLRRTAAFALIAALGATTPTFAQAPAAAAAGAVNNDLRCILLAGVLAQNKDPQARPMAQAMTLYYLGHYNARPGQAPLAAALAAQAKLITQAEANTSGQKCVQGFQTSAQALDAAMRANAPPAPAAAKPPAGPAPK